MIGNPKLNSDTWFNDVGRPRLKAVLGDDYNYLIKQCSHKEYEEAVKHWPSIVITRRNKKTGKTEQHIYNVSGIAKR